MKLLALWIGITLSLSLRAEVLATVGDHKITREDFNRKYDEVRKQSLNPPTPEQFLEEMVRYNAAVQEAEKLKLQNDPVVRERFEQVLYNALLEKELGKRLENVKVTENQMRDYYKKNPELHLAHILFEVRPDAKPEERQMVHKHALEVLDEVKKSKRQFDEIARLNSDDSQTKDNGGDIGYQSRRTMIPVIYETALAMKAGEIRGLIETQFGYHIVKLLERRNYDSSDKHQIQAALVDERRGKIFNDYFDHLKKQSKIEVLPGALKSIAQ